MPSPIHLSQPAFDPDGGLAKWLCSGLQIRVHRFDSGTRLQYLRPTNFLRLNPVNFGLYFDLSGRPGGEIGRHNGLKIRRPLTRRTGSIPVLGTKRLFQDVQSNPKKPFPRRGSAFLLSIGNFSVR